MLSDPFFKDFTTPTINTHSTQKPNNNNSTKNHSIHHAPTNESNESLSSHSIKNFNSLRFEILFLQGKATGYRNSLSYDGLFLDFDKIHLYNCGKWG
jgi:hypothetical protein